MTYHRIMLRQRADEAAKLHRAGRTLEQIADLYAVSVETVKKYIRISRNQGTAK